MELTPGEVLLRIGDDGVVFDPEGKFPGHLSLRSIRERAERQGESLSFEYRERPR